MYDGESQFDSQLFQLLQLVMLDQQSYEMTLSTLNSSQKVLPSQNHISLMKTCPKSQMSLFFFPFIYGRLVDPIYTQHFYEQ